MSRTYGQYCGLARALDLVGDRWNLLIVRQLLVAPARYHELLDGLPGVATNLLADHLRDLERAGVVERGLAAGTLDLHQILGLIDIEGDEEAARSLFGAERADAGPPSHQ